MFGSKPTFSLGQSKTAGLSSRISAPQTSFLIGIHPPFGFVAVGEQGHSFPTVKFGLFPLTSSHPLNDNDSGEKKSPPEVPEVTFICRLKLMEDRVLLKCGYSLERRNCCVIAAGTENKREVLLRPFFPNFGGRGRGSVMGMSLYEKHWKPFLAAVKRSFVAGLPWGREPCFPFGARADSDADPHQEEPHQTQILASAETETFASCNGLFGFK